jgi:hypothetical protein
MTTRFKHQPLAKMVEVFHEVRPLFKGSSTWDFTYAGNYNARWHSFGM